MPPTPIPARKATVGAVYLSPKGRELRVERIGSTDVTVFRLANNDTIQIDSEYLLTPKEAPAVAPAVAVAPVIPPHVDAVAGRGREVIQPWIRGEVPPVPTDADFDALMSADSRSWVRFEVGLERERRSLAAQAAAEVPAASRVASALGGVVVAVEPIPDAVAVTAPIVVVAQGPVDVEEIPLTPEPAPVAAETFVSEIGPAPTSDAVSAIGGHPVATGPADDLPWDAPETSDRPLVLPGASPAVAVVESTPEPVAAPVVVEVAPAVVESTQAPIVEPAPVVATPEPVATKTVKERPRGYCPGCDQLLTVRADGGMMQHFTPDGRKGPDGKRVDCQGVGLAPRPEPAPIARLTLPEAMGVPVALVSPSTDPTIVEAVAAASAVLASQPVPADVEAPGDARPADVVEPVRYTIGGSDEAGWCVYDLHTGRGMSLDPEVAEPLLFPTEAEAREALVYVREHGELPDGEESFEDYLEHADEFGAWDADKADTQAPIAADPLPQRAAWHVVALDGLSPGGAARAAALQTDLRRLADLVPAIVEAEEVRARLAAAGVSLTGF